MEKRKLSKSKVTGKTLSPDGELLFSVIVQVREPNYVPDWVTLRKRISSLFFTTDLKASDITKLEADNEVISVAINQRMDQL
jgi:hypothetical protein